jgi:hypothetical protein
MRSCAVRDLTSSPSEDGHALHAAVRWFLEVEARVEAIHLDEGGPMSTFEPDPERERPTPNPEPEPSEPGAMPGEEPGMTPPEPDTLPEGPDVDPSDPERERI